METLESGETTSGRKCRRDDTVFAESRPKVQKTSVTQRDKA